MFDGFKAIGLLLLFLFSLYLIFLFSSFFFIAVGSVRRKMLGWTEDQEKRSLSLRAMGLFIDYILLICSVIALALGFKWMHDLFF